MENKIEEKIRGIYKEYKSLNDFLKSESIKTKMTILRYLNIGKWKRVDDKELELWNELLNSGGVGEFVVRDWLRNDFWFQGGARGLIDVNYDCLLSSGKRFFLDTFAMEKEVNMMFLYYERQAGGDMEEWRTEKWKKCISLFKKLFKND